MVKPFGGLGKGIAFASSDFRGGRATYTRDSRAHVSRVKAHVLRMMLKARNLPRYTPDG